MADVVEVFWDAQPALRRLGLKGTGTGALDPRAEALFREVRSAASSVFVGAVTLVRIEVRRESRADLRVLRNGTEEPPSPALRTLIERVIDDVAYEE